MSISTTLRRGVAALTAASSLGIAAASAPAEASLLMSNCSDVSVQRSTFVSAFLAPTWRENLAFDGRGRMWVSNYPGNRIEAYDPSGRRVTSIAANAPGGLALDPSGRMQVNTGIVFGSSGTISSFDPAEAAPTLRTDVANINGHNGLAVDGKGNRYVTGEWAATVRKYRADGTFDQAWSSSASASGSNGAWADGNTVYVSRLSDAVSSVVALGVDNPSPRTVAALSPYVLNWKGLDDLTVVGNKIYVTGFISGEVIRVDKISGQACRIAGGIVMPTSVRAPIAFGTTDPSRDLFVTAADGGIHRLTITPR